MRSATVGRETKLNWAVGLGKSLPGSHGVNDRNVSVYSGILTFFPVAAGSTVVSTGVGVMSLREWHALAA